MKRILFITWDGPQTSYLEALFLPIFASLRGHGYEFCVLQFTWGDARHTDRARAACAEKGILYRRVEVWRTGAIKALLTASSGGRQVDRAVRDWSVDVLMPRSLLPGLAALLSRSSRTCPIVFDSDGLAALASVIPLSLGQPRSDTAKPSLTRGETNSPLSPFCKSCAPGCRVSRPQGG